MFINLKPAIVDWSALIAPVKTTMVRFQSRYLFPSDDIGLRNKKKKTFLMEIEDGGIVIKTI